MSQKRDTASITLTTAEVIEKNRLVRLDGSGNLVYCDAGEVPLGPGGERTVSGFPIAVDLLVNKPGTVMLTASGAISAYADVYSDADGKITSTKNSVKVGKALEAATSDGDWIEVLPDLKQFGLIYANVADATGIGASSSAEADFDVIYTLPIGILQAGDVLRIKASGICEGEDSTPQARIKLYLGTQAIAEVINAAVATSDQFLIEADITIRVAGASGTLKWQGIQMLDAIKSAPEGFAPAEAGEDISGAIVIKVAGKFDAVHAGNVLTLERLTVELLR